jgi:NAD(P)-dependent dehydrogenase (short-subunit alcohol dehydrogenase family)
MVDDLFSIRNKVIVITGSNQGIGEILAKGMQKKGAIIYRIDKRFSKSGKKKKKIYDKVCDIVDSKQIKNVCKEIFNENKKIDILINNAGITLPGNAERYSLESWIKTMDVNLTGSFQVSLEILNYMKKKRKGSIINITSLNAEFGFPDNPAYVASKGGLKLLGKSLARDWGKYGIRVNNLGPGYIKTKMTKKSFEDKKSFELRKARTMLDRWGKPEDLLGTCIFLASDASSYVTGQDIYVDGGWSANGLASE